MGCAEPPSAPAPPGLSRGGGHYREPCGESGLRLAAAGLSRMRAKEGLDTLLERGKAVGCKVTKGARESRDGRIQAGGVISLQILSTMSRATTYTMYCHPRNDFRFSRNGLLMVQHCSRRARWSYAILAIALLSLSVQCWRWNVTQGPRTARERLQQVAAIYEQATYRYGPDLFHKVPVVRRLFTRTKPYFLELRDLTLDEQFQSDLRSQDELRIFGLARVRQGRIDSLKLSSSVELLGLRGNDLSESFLTNLLATHRFLSLQFREMSLSLESLRTIQKVNSVQRLEIDTCCFLQQRSCQYLPRSLKEIEVSNLELSVTDMADIARSCPQLQYLSLSRVSLGDDVVPILLGCSHLSRVDLRETDISSEGFHKLSQRRDLTVLRDGQFLVQPWK